MKLFPPALQIESNEGFETSKDLFGRKSLGDGLTNLVRSASEPLVIAVDGQWGSGKTTFLTMWAGELRKANFPVVYFDAFAHDYVDDAFSAIAGEIIALAEERRKLQTTKGKRLLESATKVGKVVGRVGLKIGVRAATLGILDGTELRDVADDLGNLAEDAADNVLNKLLTKRNEDHAAIHEFREALSDLPDLLSDVPTDDGLRPLVFIVDELDRCRPSFALELLERMKHFFSVEGIHFVLGVHARQLKGSVAVTYGPNIDADEYLQKFIQLYFFLYEGADRKYIRTAGKFVRYLAKAMEFNLGDDDTALAVRIIEEVAVRRDLSLRSIERIMTILAIALTYTPKNFLRLPPILSVLAVLRVMDPARYLKAKRGTLRMEDVEEFVAPAKEESEEGRRADDWVYRWWNCALNGVDEDRILQSLRFKYNFSGHRELVPYLANDVIDRFRPQ